MEWKNWSSHPIIVGVGIILAVITLVNTLYKDHVKSEYSPPPATPVNKVLSSPSPIVSPSESPQSIPSPSSASSPSPKPSIQTPVKEIVPSPSASISESSQSVPPTSTKETPLLNPTKLPRHSYSQKDTVAISFKNNSSNTLKCWHVGVNRKIITFLVLEGRQAKSFENFNSGSKIACSIDIDSNSSTGLTFFSTSDSGDYELLLDRVPWSNNQGENIGRWATIVVYPNGSSYYSQ